MYTPSPHLLKKYMTEHKKNHSWVVPTVELHRKGGTHTPRNSNIVHFQNVINITTDLIKADHQVLNL